MAPVFGRRVGLPVTTSSACAAAIISQPMGVILALYLSSLVVLALLRRRWRDFFMLAIAATTVAGSLLVMLALSFIQTGMATDQQLDLMLRFANIGRLDAWGVLPQLVMVAWIRANYSELAPPVGWAVFGLLQRFTRIEFLWLVVVGAMLAYGVAISRTASQRFRQAFTVPPICIAAATHTAFLIVLLLLISAATGRVQHISYERFSSFFAPLLLLLAVAIAGLALARGDPVLRWWLARPLPAVLLVATLVVWQATAGWADRVANVTSHGLRFLGGIYSLADAYAHQGGGYWFGGINPDALAASRQVEPGTPIWSTNVASYCMVPGCHIESVSSFKMSPRLDEILAGPPERAKVLLQKAGLNYFLFSKDIPLLDVLPYSHLFAPETIGRFLGIKWSNGSAYLLTWAGPGTRPLDAGFIDAYTKRLASDDSEWFEFRTLAEQISQAVTRLRSSGPDRPARFDFALTAPPADGIDVIEATYGRSCRTYRPQPPATNTFRVGNATRALRRACSGKPYCSFTVSIPPLVDPAGGCDKDIAVTYRCPADPAPRTAAIPILAYGKAVELDCRTAR
jgi:hypothetical protein